MNKPIVSVGILSSAHFFLVKRSPQIVKNIHLMNRKLLSFQRICPVIFPANIFTYSNKDESSSTPFRKMNVLFLNDTNELNRVGLLSFFQSTVNRKKGKSMMRTQTSIPP
ncbi:hypothetical protein DLM78_03640 [Leptospira stimsonii]|uniref:Uncharacterized protein n=1 Tax=Leptospira stimsonii TaxID=2202203 RepID=A0A8B3CUX2_9LEPT|nr:hypothetical protein DLM78_03640 [Leptospira stimsonii]